MNQSYDNEYRFEAIWPFVFFYLNIESCIETLSFKKEKGSDLSNTNSK